MFSNVSLKTVAFYSSAIAAVITLFTVVSSYGETTLKAPPKITGLYKVQSNNLPSCLQNQNLQLQIRQSGIYIAASLISVDQGNRLEGDRPSKPKSTTKDKSALFGKWQNNQLGLKGTLAHVKNCSAQDTLSIEAILTNKNLQGRLNLNTEGADFYAQLEESAEADAPQRH